MTPQERARRLLSQGASGPAHAPRAQTTIGTPEAQRIVTMPLAPTLTSERVEELNKENVLAHAYFGECECPKCAGRPFRLLPDQVAGLDPFLRYGKGFMSIRVGGGKTALAMLAASHFFRKSGGRGRCLILIPSNLYEQWFYRDLPWAREHLALSVPFMGLGKRSKSKRRAIASAKAPGCYVMTYSQLSTEDTIELLAMIEPALVICDEAQSLAGDVNSSAKNKRFWSFIFKQRPKGLAFSGTLTARDPVEYLRIARWCMEEFCPLPNTIVEATDWANLIRSKALDPTPFEARPMVPLLEWARRVQPGDRFPATVNGLRSAYRLRLHTAPGFMTSGDDELGTSLEIAQYKMDPPSEALIEAIARVEEDMVAPDGEQFSHKIELHGIMQELTAGFYHHRYWPEDHPLVNEAKDLWEATNEYRKALREFFNSTTFPRPGLDTPKVVGIHHAQHGPITEWEHLYDLWEEVEGLKQPGLPERFSEPVWVDDYKVNTAIRWAKKHRKQAIVWCLNKAVARRIYSELAAAGHTVLHKGSGDSWLEGDGSAKGIVVATIKAHCWGRNLQEFKHQLVVQWPRSPIDAEQMLGRCHRTGQDADRLVVHTTFVLDADHKVLSECLADTCYSAQTLGGTKKLLIADWVPSPKNPPADFTR